MVYKGFAILLQWRMKAICTYLLESTGSNFFPERANDQKSLETCNLESPRKIREEYSSSLKQRVSGLRAPTIQCWVQILTLSIQAGCPQPMLSSRLHPEKAGAGQGTRCRFFPALREALPAFPESRHLAVLETNPGRSCLEQGSLLYRHSGKSPPSSEAG